VRKYLAVRLGHMQVGRILVEHMHDYRRWLDSLPIKPQTVVHVLSDARCFLLWCVECGLLDRTPFPRRVMPRIQERPPDRLTEDAAASLLGLPDPWGFVIRLGLGTGLRWGEMVRLQRTDLEGNELVIHHTKSGKVRRVPVFPPLLGEIRNRVGRLVGFAEASAGSFNRRVRSLTGLDRFHNHQLRHEFACRWLERTGDLIALQQVLGHASIVTTLRYASLSAAHVRATAKRFAEGGQLHG
jgi:integrase